MSHFVRRRSRSSSTSQRQNSQLRRSFMRHLGGAERLETRSLMAGDIYAGLWNPAWPTDVNADKSVDPQDLLNVVYGLNTRGMGSLSGPATAAPAGGGEGEAQVPGRPDAYIDVDRDGQLSPADVLWVLNELNDTKPEGAGELVKFRVAAVKIGTGNTSGDSIDVLSQQQNFHPGNGGSSNPTPATTLTEDFNIGGIAAIDKGTEFELRFYVQDISSVNSTGVFSGYFDVDYNAGKATPIVNEVQAIQFNTDTEFTGGTFSLTYNNQSVTVTPVFVGAVMDKTATATAIKNALVPLMPSGPGGGANALDVFYITPTVQTAPKNRWEVRFKGALQDTNVSPISANIANLQGGTNTSVTIEEFNGKFVGTSTNTEAFRRSFVPSTAQILDEQQRQGRAYTANVAAADALVPNVMNEIGTLGQPFGPNPGTTEREFLRVRMKAIDGTAPGQPIQFVLSAADLTSSKTLLFRDPALVIDPLTQIDFGQAFPLIVREYVSAFNDLFTQANVTTATGGGFQLNVLGDNGSGPDTSTLGAAGTAFQIDATTVPSTGSMGGQLVVLPGNTAIRYTPAPGFTIAPQGASGPNVQQETFVYTIASTNASQTNVAAYRDTATVTINLIVPNAPPINNVPISVPLNEGGTFTFNGVNTISVSDADAGAVALTTTLSVPSGSITLVGGNSAGVTGSGTSTVTINQTLANLNTVLAGLTYTPATPDSNGVVNLTITTNDNGSGVGTPAIDVDFIGISIIPINDAPTQTLPALGLETTDEDPLAITGITVSDIDVTEGIGTYRVTTTIAVQTGSFGTLNVTNMGAFQINGANTRTLTIEGTPQQVSDTLATLVYTPVVNQVGVMTINVTTTDNGNSPNPPASSATQPFTINVIAKARPKAIDDTPANGVNYTFAEETTTVAFLAPLVTANDRVHDGFTANLQVNAISNVMLNYSPLIGGASVAAPAGLLTQIGDDIEFNGTLLPVNFFGTVSFDYLMDDAFTPDEVGADYEGHVIITITNVNDAPTAVADNPPVIQVNEDLSIPINVVANDTDPDGDALTATIVTGPANGTIVSNVNGTVTYKGNQDFFGLDSFTYRANDGAVNSAELITVTIDVLPVNDAPVTNSFTVVTPEGTPVVIAFGSMVSDVDNAVDLSTIIAGPAAHGTLVKNADNTWTYTPNNPSVDYFGTDSFTYTASDGTATSTAGTVSLVITPVNDAPDASDDTMVTGEGQTMDFDVLANDFDVDASATFLPVDGLLSAGTTINITTGPAHGIASVVGGKIRYTPTGTYNGPDSIVYQLNDNDPLAPASQLSNLATVTITVLEKNDPPVAVNDPGISTNEDVTAAIDVFFNDSDPDTANTLWSFVLDQAPLHGVATFNAGTRKVDYKPNDNYFGGDSFTYHINDNSPINPTNLSSNIATVTINVVEVNDPPVFAPVTPGLIIANGSISYVNSIDILGKVSSGVDTDALDKPFVITFAGTAGGTSLQSEAGGVLTITADGKIEYKAPVGQKDFNDSFVVKVKDRNGTGIEVSQTVSFFVQEAVPFNLHLNVFADSGVQGVREATDVGLAGIGFTITGVDFRGQTVNITNVFTDGNGRLDLNALLPGVYTVTQIQPGLIDDGIATSNDSRVQLLSQTNDSFRITVGIVPAQGQSPDITINFGERPGASTTSQAYAQSNVLGATPYQNHIVSGSSSGMLLGSAGANAAGFYAVMGGWANVGRIELTNIVITDALTGSATLKVYAVGSATSTDVTIQFNKLPGFSIIGGLANGSRMYRINATAAQLGLTAFIP